MIRNIPYWRTAQGRGDPRAAGSVFGASPALAARDRTPPTKPTNLRVTSVIIVQCVAGLEPVHR